MMINEQLGGVESSDPVMAHSVAKRSCPMLSSPAKWWALYCFTLGSVTPPLNCLEGGKVLAFTGRWIQPLDAVGVGKQNKYWSHLDRKDFVLGEGKLQEGY